jgi:hypothetical protein
MIKKLRNQLYAPKCVEQEGKKLYMALEPFVVSFSFTQSVELLGQGISPSQGRSLPAHRAA